VNAAPEALTKKRFRVVSPGIGVASGAPAVKSVTGSASINAKRHFSNSTNERHLVIIAIIRKVLFPE
jgi:hypothetical protein